MYLLLGVIFMVLAFMAYQDFKYRGIYWWLFPLLCIGLLRYCSITRGWQPVYSAASFNAVFLLVQLVLISLYISVKKRRLTNIFKGCFGLGDLLFLCCAACCFSALNYVLFYIISLFLTITLTLAFRFFQIKVQEKIPLAGYQALLLMVLMLVDRVQGSWHLFSDEMLLNFTAL
jgi:hypothetical protein